MSTNPRNTVSQLKRLMGERAPMGMGERRGPAGGGPRRRGAHVTHVPMRVLQQLQGRRQPLAFQPPHSLAAPPFLPSHRRQEVQRPARAEGPGALPLCRRGGAGRRVPVRGAPPQHARAAAPWPAQLGTAQQGRAGVGWERGGRCVDEEPLLQEPPLPLPPLASLSTPTSTDPSRRAAALRHRLSVPRRSSTWTRRLTSLPSS